MRDIKTKNLGSGQGPNQFDGESFFRRHISDASKLSSDMKREPFDPVLIGRRLEAIRIAKDAGTQNEFAATIGASTNRYNNWAVGVAPIPVPYAAKIKELTGIPLDYIYLGEVSGLPLALSKRLQEAKASISSTDE